MSAAPASRFTVCAAHWQARGARATDGIPWAHCDTEATARDIAAVTIASRRARPTRIAERERCYPFTVIRTVWTCDANGGPS